VSFSLRGDTNDYAGKGLSGGTLAVMPPDGVTYAAEDNVIIGISVLYGATSGRAFFRGLAGERFAVRNSGAHAVVEGVGDHGCEYMTGGKVVILGATGRNFAAGMSGGIAYVYDPQGVLPDHLNAEMVELEGLDDDDVESLRDLLVAHVDNTDSAVAQGVLSDWESELKHFVKVMPRDYKSVLAAIAEAEQRGADETGIAEAIMAAARG
jgi:glutamate synthase (NADPH/NADH) large chain